MTDVDVAARGMALEAAEKVDNISQVVPSKNLFNPSSRAVGYFVEHTNGNLVASASYDTSDYIPVTFLQNYALTPCRKIAFYNASKGYVSGVDVSPVVPKVVTAPANAAYVRVSFPVENVPTAQVEAGSVFTPYQPFGTAYGLRDQVRLPGAPSDLTVVKTGENFNISSVLGNNAILLETKRNGSQNGSFSFVATKLNGERFHDVGDDICPIRTFTTLGANHGYTCIVKISMAGHDKTAVDLGSIWTDGTKQYTLLQINGNELVYGAAYTVNGDGTVTAPVPPASNPAANLTHVSGATHTAAVNISTINPNVQGLLPSINNISVKYVLDGAEITGDGVYFGDELKVFESYDIMDYKSLIDYAQANIGTSYANNSVAGVIRLSIVYTITKGCNCLITHNFKVLKKVTTENCGFIQALQLALSGHTLKRYMPGVKPKSGVDFANIVDMTSYATNLLYLTADCVDPAKPPNRYVDWLYDGSGNKKAGFTAGYIPDKSNSKNADRVTNIGSNPFWDMRSTKKSYPVGLSRLTLNTGDYKTFMAYRCYLPPSSATNINVVRDTRDTYVFIDYHAAVSGANIPLPDDIGKTVTVLDSSNFTLLNDTVDSDGITYSITSTYGYAVLKCS